MGRLPSLDTLRVFSIAARHMSFTKAANELHLTQSAVSHRVRALEEELGMPLFNRLPRRLKLTRAGQALAQRVDQAVAWRNESTRPSPILHAQSPTSTWGATRSG